MRGDKSMSDKEYDLKSEECINDMLFILKELHQGRLLSEEEYNRAVAMILKRDY
jgi:hypothetical protein